MCSMNKVHIAVDQNHSDFQPRFLNISNPLNFTENISPVDVYQAKVYQKNFKAFRTYYIDLDPVSTLLLDTFNTSFSVKILFGFGF